MTNFDVVKHKIMSMTEEEFANAICAEVEFLTCSECKQSGAWRGRCTAEACTASTVDWLKMQHKPTSHTEEKQETITRVHMMCSCGGEYFPHTDYLTALTISNMIEHQCNKCGRVTSFDKSYPYNPADAVVALWEEQNSRNRIDANPVTTLYTTNTTINPFEGDVF